MEEETTTYYKFLKADSHYTKQHKIQKNYIFIN